MEYFNHPRLHPGIFLCINSTIASQFHNVQAEYCWHQSCELHSYRVTIMNQTGPIIIIDDDKDDQEIIQDMAGDLAIPNPIVFFDDTHRAFSYLKETEQKPLVIFSDLNLPQESGFDLKRRIDGDPRLRSKSIPFIFFSTFIDKRIVDLAYRELTIQGFFQKVANYNELKATFKMIIDYWTICKHPNSF